MPIVCLTCSCAQNESSQIFSWINGIGTTRTARAEDIAALVKGCPERLGGAIVEDLALLIGMYGVDTAGT